TRALESHSLISIIREEVMELPESGVAVVATGPLTSEPLANAIREITGRESLYFYDAISPIVEGASLTPERIFPASRSDKGDNDYVTCPLNEEEYSVFQRELGSAHTVPLHEFEKEIYFEGCLPIEVIAKRGRDTMAFGPMKPVGLTDPRTGERPFAVVQLRREDREGTMYNLVGFQTKLTYGEQLRIFRLIPGLEQAVFLRYGSAHRNTFINSPRLLHRTLQLKGRENLFFAGQIVGVEGYVESAAMGLVAGIHAARWIRGLPLVDPPAVTAHGSLLRYISAANPRHFQPMNANYGLFLDLDRKVRDRKSRHAAIASRALQHWKDWLQRMQNPEEPG
ncbi:MAG: FADH(2)-oxidizing methylenetetrahydrofolate--tRNA-(uracil(54)-C(5))-methyltransferase TrmFO, partial [Candidatus Tectomicrobia bacterium]|nr:FADH(2)-oxidizing methylenetetrahydrofolate--tRNA-(uracil(54)-C(5))-methyltransferase TrmFO [Candidatus Tectomicrobia bacterium]